MKESCEYIFWEFWECRSRILVCMVEKCTVCYAFNFATRRTMWYGCDFDVFCFSIFVIRLCKVRVRMTRLDTYA